MKKRDHSVKWLGIDANRRNRLTRRSPMLKRRIQLEPLEPRYVLTAPTAVGDSFFEDYGNVAQQGGHLDVLANDTPAAGRPLFQIGAVNGVAVGGNAQTYSLANGTLNLSADHTY